MNNEATNINTLISKLKQKDENHAKMSKAFMVIYAILILLFLVMMSIDFIKEHDPMMVLPNLFILIPFTIFYVVLRKAYKQYRNVDYNKSILIMLRSVVKRYRLFSPEALWSIFALLLISIQPLVNDGLNRLPIIEFLVTFLIFTSALLGGVIWWYFSYKPIQDSAKQLIKEIEG